MRPIKQTDAANGTAMDGGITMNNNGILSQMTTSSNVNGTGMSRSVSDYSAGAENDYLKLFQFVAKNTEIEFSLTFFNNDGQNKISLQRLDDSVDRKTNSPSPFTLGLTVDQTSKQYHNHPSTARYNYDLGTLTEMDSMGDTKGGTPLGDLSKAKNKSITYPNFVFFPGSTNLYNVTQQGIKLVKKINNDYKKLK